MNCEAVAMPLPLVVTVTVVLVFAKVPLAPLAGAMKMTETPLTGLPDSVTVAARLVAKGLLTVVLWGVPALAVIAKLASNEPMSTAAPT